MSSTALNDLQKQAAKLLAEGKTPTQVRDELALSITSFETWRTEETFVAEVAKLRAEAELTRLKTAGDASTDALDAELDRMAR